MRKNFDNWNLFKKDLDSVNHFRGFGEREIWWCHFGINVGDEQNGKNEEFTRPVLILKKFNNSVFLGLPLTTTRKKHPLYHPIIAKGREGSVILSQIKLLSVKRLKNNSKIMKISESVFNEIKRKVKDMI